MSTTNKQDVVNEITSMVEPQDRTKLDLLLKLLCAICETDGIKELNNRLIEQK